MEHYVLIKLKDGVDKSAVAVEAPKYLSRCIGAIDGFEAIEVYENCFPREGNYDLMLKMDMRDVSTLNEYIPHSLHEEFIKYIAPKTVNKITFDRE